MNYKEFTKLPLNKQIELFKEYVIKNNIKCSIPYLNDLNGLNDCFKGWNVIEKIENLNNNSYYNKNDSVIVKIDYNTIDTNDFLSNPRIVSTNEWRNFCSTYHTTIFMNFIKSLEAL